MIDQIDLIFDERADITLQQLNDHYGDRGRSFPTLEEAQDHAEKHPGSHLSSLWDYQGGCRGRIGYLVTIAVRPPSRANGRYLGKPRATSNYD